MKEYQVTLMCADNKYKPISCIVKKQEEVTLTNKAEKVSLAKEGIQKICAKRRWSGKDLKRFGYTRTKVREYNREKIEQEKADNYDLIKAIKYTTGEWQKPKSAEV